MFLANSSGILKFINSLLLLILVINYSLKKTDSISFKTASSSCSDLYKSLFTFSCSSSSFALSIVNRCISKLINLSFLLSWLFCFISLKQNLIALLSFNSKLFSVFIFSP